MNYFQLIASVVTGSFFIHSMLQLRSGKQPRVVSLAAMTVWFLGSLFILSPHLAMQCARFLGIGRGADLVLYVFVILFIVTVFYSYSRIRILESQITEIVRHIAVSAAERSNRSSEVAGNEGQSQH